MVLSSGWNLNSATLFMLLVLNQGHWLSGQQATISVMATVDTEQTRSFVLEWELAAGAVKLASGTIGGRDGKTTVTINVPEVRTQTALVWSYRIRTADGKVISSESASVIVYPKLLIDDLSARYENRTVNLHDTQAELAGLLNVAHIKCQPIRDLTRAMLDRPDILLIGPNAPQSVLEPKSLTSLAAAGTQILILRQEGNTAAGYQLAKSRPGQTFAWRTSHPLFTGLDAEILNGWVRGAANAPIVIQVPVDDASLEIGYHSFSTAAELQPIDAIVLEKSIGAGRLILLQLPCANWSTDPRSQILLNNTLQYVTERPTPTRAPSRRPIPRALQPASVPTITIPSGDSK